MHIVLFVVVGLHSLVHLFYNWLIFRFWLSSLHMVSSKLLLDKSCLCLAKLQRCIYLRKWPCAGAPACWQCSLPGYYLHQNGILTQTWSITPIGLGLLSNSNLNRNSNPIWVTDRVRVRVRIRFRAGNILAGCTISMQVCLHVAVSILVWADL